MPNYGSNDGSLVLPLSSCDFLDYRPALQAAHYLVHRGPCFQKGEWDEQTEWLIGTEFLHMDRKIRQWRTEFQKNQSHSGYLKLTARESSAMLRAARYAPVLRKLISCTWTFGGAERISLAIREHISTTHVHHGRTRSKEPPSITR